jgi:hypothetical protein
MPIVPLAPITPTQLLCLGCGGQMRLVVEQYRNKKVSRIVFYCDSCKYGHEPSMQHAPGQTVAYVAPSNPQPATANPTSAETKAASGG